MFKHIKVSCKNCNIEWQKDKSSLKVWKGYCRKCASTIYSWIRGKKIDRKKYPHLGHFGPHKEETKRKLHFTNSQYKHTEEAKKNIALHNARYWKGKELSEETRIKIGLGGIGKHVGEKNGKWIKDRTLLKRKELRNDSAYQDFVKQVKRRDSNSCKLKDEQCDGYCIVHHIVPWRDAPELRYEIKNGITLCQAHHPRKRAEEKRLIPALQVLVPTL